MARPLSPRNQDTQIESDNPQVPSADPLKPVPKYPRMVVKGGVTWGFYGLNDRSLYPSPYSTGWDRGWMPRATRRAMLRHHKISQGVNNLINAILGKGGRLVEPISPYGPQKDQFEKAREIRLFCEFALRNMNPQSVLNGDFYSVLRQMLACVHEGHKLAPIVLRVQQDGPYKGFRTLETLTVWENGTYSFWEDEFGNFCEVRIGGANLNETRWPRSKFFILTWRPDSNLPYGNSVLTAAYDPFYKDIMIDYEEMAYVSQFGRPSIVIFASPPPDVGDKVPEKLYYADGSPVLEEDDEGNIVHRLGYETEQNALMFKEFQAGSIWSLEHGALVEVVEARQGGADMFRLLRDQNARNMMAAIYGTHQVTEAERSLSQNNAEVGEGVAGLNVTEGKAMLERSIEMQILTLLVRQNFGPQYMHLVPLYDLGSGQNARAPQIVNSLTGIINGGNFDADQWWWICYAQGWPMPYPDAPMMHIREIEAKKKADLKPKIAPGQKPGGGDKTSGNPPQGDPGNGDNNSSKRQ